MYTDVAVHPQAVIELHTGSFRFQRPSMGAWVLYGLGTENTGAARLHHDQSAGRHAKLRQRISARLVSRDQDRRRRRRTPRRRANRQHRKPEAHGRIATQAARSAGHQPGTARTRQGEPGSGRGDRIVRAGLPHGRSCAGSHGSVHRKTKRHWQPMASTKREPTRFGRQCLLARRFAEAGVRFIELGFGGWDQHSNLQGRNSPPTRMRSTSQSPHCSADLKQRGMLKDTLVVWGGEFGRTPAAQQAMVAITINRVSRCGWPAAASRGAIATARPTSTVSPPSTTRCTSTIMHATMLYLLGLDHTKLTYQYSGREIPADRPGGQGGERASSPSGAIRSSRSESDCLPGVDRPIIVAVNRAGEPMPSRGRR